MAWSAGRIAILPELSPLPRTTVLGSSIQSLHGMPRCYCRHELRGRMRGIDVAEDTDMSSIPCRWGWGSQQQKRLNLHVPWTATAHHQGRGCWSLLRAKKPKLSRIRPESFFCIREIFALSGRERAGGPVSWVESMTPGEYQPRFPAAYEMSFSSVSRKSESTEGMANGLSRGTTSLEDSTTRPWGLPVGSGHGPSGSRSSQARRGGRLCTRPFVVPGMRLRERLGSPVPWEKDCVAIGS